LHQILATVLDPRPNQLSGLHLKRKPAACSQSMKVAQERLAYLVRTEALQTQIYWAGRNAQEIADTLHSQLFIQSSTLACAST